jgi:hypothetical protein
MKTRIILALLFACTVASSHAQSSKSPLVGTWEMTSAIWTEGGKETHWAIGKDSGSQLKMYSQGYFLFVGREKESDKPAADNFGGGTYTLMGDNYSETIQYHTMAGLVGKTLHFKLVIKGNTMTMTGPIAATAEDQKNFGAGQLVEVFVKKD